MKLHELKNKKILIAGYGREGKATEKYLLHHFPGTQIDITDKKDGENYLDKQVNYDLVIKTPGIPKEKITVPYTTATNIFFANKSDHPIIGVTGTKGKSTTAALIRHILTTAKIPVRLVGNIGNPALEELIHPPEEKTYFVYELSSYQLDDIQYSPHISVIVSLFPEHMNYHGTVDLYYSAKRNILAHATAEDYYVYNPGFLLLKTWSTSFPGKVVAYEKDFVPEHIPLPGIHNSDNARAAITVARILNIDDALSAKAIQTFKGLPHRIEKVGTFQNITFYDDAISTTPESTIAALQAIPDVKTIFLGGEDRGYDFSNLVDMLKHCNVENVVLFPESGKKIGQILKQNMTQLPRILEADTMEEAIRFAYKHTPSGTVCLLSTASPSYSLWENFEQKGEQFQTYVKTLATKEKTQSDNKS